MLTSYRILSVSALLLAATTVQAEGWSGKIGAGAIATSGNSESSTFQLDLGLGYERDVWHNSFKASAMQARSEQTDAAGLARTQTTSERYVLSLRSALDFSKTDFAYAQLDFEKDLFGGVRERSVQTLGYGRRLLKTPTQALDVEIGAGARQSKAQETGAQRESEFIGRGALNYAWTISETSRFAQKLSVETGETNTYSESVSELKLSVIGAVFANLGLTVKNNSDVPADTEHTDSIYSVSLSYEF